MPEPFGHFSGDPRTRWISSSSAPDRTMELLEEFHYVDPDGKEIPPDQAMKAMNETVATQ